MRYLPAVALCLLLAACVTSPEPDFYVLDAVLGSVISQDNFSVKIQRPALPAYLDRAQIVRQTGDKRVIIDEMKDWAEPLDRMFERVLAQDIQSRVPQGLVVTESDAISAPARFTVEISIRQFNALDDTIALTGEWVIQDKFNPGQITHQSFSYSANGSRSVGFMIDGLNGLIGEMADNILVQLHDLPAKTVAP